MNNVPHKHRRQLAVDPYYSACARTGLFGHECAGRITWEHALVHRGRQVQSRFAILPICESGHGVNRFQDGGDMRKEVHVWIALNRASEPELEAISRATDYVELRQRLNRKYGAYEEPEQVSSTPFEIAYPWLRTV